MRTAIVIGIAAGLQAVAKYCELGRPPLAVGIGFIIFAAMAFMEDIKAIKG